MIDSIVKKGIFHRSVPQDYVVAEDLGTAQRPFPFIALSDGCSAGQHSEVGAVVVTRAAKAIAKSYYERQEDAGSQLFEYLLSELQGRLIEAIKILGLELDDLIATLRVAYILDGKLYMIGQGDGFDLFILGDGTAQFDQYEYLINAPFYPAYDAFHCRLGYEMIGGRLGANSLNLNRDTTTQPDLTGAIHTFPCTYISKMSADLADFKPMYVGVASDGLGSYVRNNTDIIPPKDVITSLAAIKNPAGEFLVRRFQKMDKEYTAQGFENQDDIAVALINVDCYRETVERNKP